MTPTNCPNCGAIVHGAQCDYCGTRFDSGDGEVIRAWGGEPVLVTVQGGIDDDNFDEMHELAKGIARCLFTPNEARRFIGR